jgi:FKBP-type peptidyl-prolyl cis-trans isomerase 2
VTVNYIGIFGSGPEQGKVFDTSIYSVAINNAAFPKSLQYHARGIAANYSPLAVHVGSNTPQSGFSYAGLSFIQVVTGFWQGLVGLPGNTSKLVDVPPELGYGPADPSCFRSLPLTVHVPVLEQMRGNQFSARYPGILATTGATFNSPSYGWPVLILSANQSFVTVENLPTVGFTSSIAGWPTTVTNITQTANGSGRITVQNELAPSDAGRVSGHVANGLCGAQSNGNYIISSVNFATGTFVEDFNQEVRGVILLFAVTVINIYTPISGLV